MSPIEPNDRDKLQYKLGQVCVDDVIFGEAGNHHTKLMLVELVSGDEISARHVLTQARVRFDRATGRSTWCEGGGSCRLVSVAPLPPEQFQTVIGLDRKMRLASLPHGFRLDQSELMVILSLDDYYRANPLPVEVTRTPLHCEHLSAEHLTGEANDPDAHHE